jgi:hypothetical protein
MLKVTTTAPSGMGEGAGRHHAVGTGLENCDRISPTNLGRFVGNGDVDQFTGNAVTDKNNATIVQVADGPSRGGTLKTDGNGGGTHPRSLLTNAGET